MHIAAGILLLVSGVFNFVVWPSFYRRVARDSRARDSAGKATRFLTVHRVIVAVAYAIGGLTVLGGVASFVLPWL